MPPRSPHLARRPSPRARTAGRAAPDGRPPRPAHSYGETRVPHPLLLLEEAAAEREPLLGLRAVAGDDVLELVPVGLGVFPDAVVAAAQLRVRHRESELPDLRYVPVEEPLPRLL